MKRTIWGIAFLILIVIYFTFDPSKTLFPKCPFLLLTGYQCPGCGSQRAIHSLLHLDILEAIRYNALLVLSIPVIMLLIFAEVVRTKKPQLYTKLHNPKLILAYALIIIVWAIARNF